MPTEQERGQEWGQPRQDAPPLGQDGRPDGQDAPPLGGQPPAAPDTGVPPDSPFKPPAADDESPFE
ncbi:hypothetical protein [Thioalkalivibrio sp. ALJT]|uniref:hypothetical protein n=1 Tax=Thioalkalivibrio sp. ALJT TaxID=1158146 RepID=UPI00036654DD|nr:hypothetical protein [Thioalkalivibrio sp. ALJT]